MRSASRTVVALVSAALVVVSLAACTSSPMPHPTTTPLPSTSASFTGAESGTVYLTKCGTANSDQIIVVLAGTKTRLHGVLTPTNMSFDGKDAIYQVVKTGTLPTFGTDGRYVRVDRVVLTSVRKPSRALVFSGIMACP